MTKPAKMTVHPAKTQISLGIYPVWSESSLSAWRKLGSLATSWAHGEDSDQTGWMPRLSWVFPGHTATLLVLSWVCSFLWALPLLFLKKAPISFNDIWSSAWDYGTYHIGDRRRLRQACASAQSRQSLRCSHTWSMEVDEGSDKKNRHPTPLDGYACAFEVWVTEEEKCYNLMSWLFLLYCIQEKQTTLLHLRLMT